MPGIYISYPFCAQKCTYCNFASGVFPRDWEAKYWRALLREIRNFALPWRPETLYLGGGTPSSLETEALRELLDAIPGRPWLEATIEAAPGTLNAGKIAAWRDCGINRVSLGVQSFVQRELARTGRKHAAQTVEREIKLLRDGGIDNFNIDLISGLPSQTESSWSESLDWIEFLAPPHVSIYMLEVDDDSRLGSEILLGGKRYGASDAPSDDSTAAFYEKAVERLAAIGIRRYEISNFAKPGFESRHNLKYWRREPYVGFGADAHSFDGTVRWRNVESAADYMEREAVRIEATPANALEEKFFVGLRLSEGIRPTGEEWRHYRAPIERFLDAGFLESDGTSLRLTPRGVMISNEVFQEFLG
ncbi:MAG: radical SAM family heme chaperone HemW [Bryobacteraceae bacterium]